MAPLHITSILCTTPRQGGGHTCAAARHGCLQSLQPQAGMQPVCGLSDCFLKGTAATQWLYESARRPCLSRHCDQPHTNELFDTPCDTLHIGFWVIDMYRRFCRRSSAVPLFPWGRGRMQVLWHECQKAVLVMLCSDRWMCQRLTHSGARHCRGCRGLSCHTMTTPALSSVAEKFWLSRARMAVMRAPCASSCRSTRACTGSCLGGITMPTKDIDF